MSSDGAGKASSIPPDRAAQKTSGAAVQVVPVRIAGHEYKIRSSGDPEQLQLIAGYVDRAMKRVRERTGTVDSLDVAVLTCLNLSREILALRERGGEQTAGESVDLLQLRNLIERVESAVTGSGKAPPVGASVSVPTTEPEAQRGRTLELPSVEALRDREASAAGGNAPGTNVSEGISASRIAVGGRRDRAS